jgi:TolB-like protein/tetratricopeptide (TPR) repeat protein
MSSGPDDGYFADGLTEEILNSLARLPELLVTARTSAFSFKGKDIPVQEIAAVLKVQHIVEGSVRRSGDRLRVTAQLIRAEDGFHLWSETYDRDAGDTFRIQTDIAEKIALALDVVLDDERRARMAFANVRNPEAFVAYQKGMELFVLAHGSLPQLPTLKKANVYFDQAILLEPDFYSAHVARGDFFSHALISLDMDGSQFDQLDLVSMDETRQALVENFEAAIRSAPDAARRLNTEFDRAFILGNWRGLASLIDAVLNQNGDCLAPSWLHLATAAFGRAEEALLDYENLIACDPLSQNLPGNWVGSAMWSGRFDRVIDVAGSYNDSGQRKDIGAYITALAAAGRIEEARAVIDTEVRQADAANMFHGIVAAMKGDAGQLARMFAGRPLPADSTFGKLLIAARLGDRETANDVARSIDSHPFGYVPLLQVVYFCNCGAPFDLEATPTLAGMLQSSGLPWPPAKVVNWPLKHW